MFSTHDMNAAERMCERIFMIFLAELLRGEKRGRASTAEITMFKSVGTALEDLCAASLVVGGC